MTPDEGPSAFLLLATRLRHLEKLPLMGTMELVNEFWFIDCADFPERDLLTSANHPPQWASGPAFCLACQTEWAAVAESGTTQLECPECKRLTGHWKFEFAPAVGTKWRVCGCDNKLFYLTPEGHLCASCGAYQGY